MLENGKPMRYDHLNIFMFNCIVLINKMRKLKLTPSHYTPHTLRSGGCTDLARDDKPG